jgi:DNA-binding CsgD family transcriptional regulator
VTMRVTPKRDRWGASSMTTTQESRAAETASVLRGRDTMLAAVDAGLAAATHGRGRILLVEGHCGSGKTRTLHEARRRAGQSGMRTLIGEALDDQRTFPFAPLLAATVGSVPPVGDPDVLRALGANADLRYWVVHDLRAALQAAAATTPLVLLLDDLNRADAGTLMAVQALTAELRHAGILWVLSCCRGGVHSPALREAIHRLSDQGAQRLDLAPLPPQETAAIVADVVGAPADQHLLALAEQAMGNPAVLLELLRGLREENRLSIVDGFAVVVDADQLPRRLTEVVAERLGRLGDDANWVVRVAAMLPHPFTVVDLADVLLRRPTTLVGPLEELLRADLLVGEGDHLRFRHELLRRATRDSLPRPLRRALDAEIQGVRCRATSPNLAEAPVGPDPESAPPPFDTVVATPARHHVRLAFDRWIAGDIEPAAIAARHALECTDVTSDDRAHGFAVLTLAGAHLSRGESEQATDRLDELLSRDYQDADAPLRNLHIANLLHCLGRTGEAAETLIAAQRSARRAGDGPLISLCTQFSVMLNLAAGRVTDARARAKSMALPLGEAGDLTLASTVQMISYAGLALHTGDTELRGTAQALAGRAQSDDSPATRRWAARVMAVLADTAPPLEAIRLIGDDPLLPAALPMPADQDFLVFAARLAAATRNVELADRARTAAAALTTRNAPPRVLAGVSAYVTGVLDHDIDQLRAAASTLQGVRPLLYASACEQIGSVLAKQNRVNAATSQWNQALEAYAMCDAAADVRRLTRRLRDQVHPGNRRATAGWASLTEMERKVVQLVARGATNREAARMLFLSPHTISTHLRRAFAKLDINSRVQLANRLRDIGV